MLVCAARAGQPSSGSVLEVQPAGPADGLGVGRLGKEWNEGCVLAFDLGTIYGDEKVGSGGFGGWRGFCFDPAVELLSDGLSAQ